MIDRSVIDQVREATDIVELVGETVELRQVGAVHLGLCPFHDDTRPSLRVSVEKQGWYCHPCGGKGGDVFAWVMFRDGVGFRDAAQLLAHRAGIEIRDDIKPRMTPRHQGVTVAQLAREKNLDASVLAALGVTDAIHDGQPVVRFPYLDENLHEVTFNLRIRLQKGPGRDDRFWRQPGVPAIPYGIWCLGTSRAKERGFVVLVEGETDFVTLLQANVPALAAPSNRWKESWSHHLDGIRKIIVAVEPKQSGDGFVKALQESSLWPRCSLIAFGQAIAPMAQGAIA